MQYNQPQFGGSPYLIASHQFNQNNLNPFACQPPTPNASSFDYLVGEGDIVPSQQLDGTQRFFFVPRVTYPQARRPCWCNLQPCYCNWILADQAQAQAQAQQVHAWFVRSIAISFAPPVSPTFNTLPVQDQLSHLGNLQNQHNLMNQRKITFHSDNGTSTTDLYLYYPALRSNLWGSRPCACVQTSSIDKPSTCQCNSQQAAEEKARKSNEEKKKKKKRQYIGVAEARSCTICSSLENINNEPTVNHYTSRYNPGPIFNEPSLNHYTLRYIPGSSGFKY